VLSPLAGFLPPLLIIGPMIATTVLACWGARRRGNEASLLWRLAVAAECGLPLAEEVEAVALDAPPGRQVALLAVAERIRDGRSLADALGMGERLLPRPVILSIRAAENTDALPGVLRAAADRAVNNIAEIGGPRDVLPFQAYVTNVCIVVIGVLFFLMYWIVPKYKDIVNDFGLELPPPTQLLIAASDGMLSFWYLLFPLVTLPIGLFMLPGIVALMGWENLNFPLLMRWFPRRDGPPVLRAASVGVELQRSLPAIFRDLAEHHHREDMRTRLGRIAESVDSGGQAWAAMRGEQLIRKSEAAALEAAARAGHLPWAMRSLADIIDHRQRVREAWWAEWQRPVIIFSLAAIVGLVCVGMFLPLITILNSLV
jgi:type II secretory pathway component PulF